MSSPTTKRLMGVYKYFDYVEGCYTYAIQLVTSAISTNDRVDGFDLRIYHRSFERQERLYLEHTDIDANEPKREPYLRRLMELLCYKLNRMSAKTKSELALELIDTTFSVSVYGLFSVIARSDSCEELRGGVARSCEVRSKAKQSNHEERSKAKQSRGTKQSNLNPQTKRLLRFARNDNVP